VPLLPGQILWINMLTHGLPGVAMGAEPAAPDVLRRTPLAPDAPVLDRSLLRRIGLTGAVITAATLAAALLARHAGSDGRTAAFLVLGLAQIGVALASRDPGASRRNAFLTVAAVVAAGLMVAAILIPALRELLRTEPLPPAQWLVCLLLAAVPGGLLLAVRARRPRT
jgi:Ca2+-transporting ATPase